ncbi:phosphonate metabolism transcriptional regulator PhnF [Jannaschia sp. 2305UL9-9]|uniref:phosphonate metabolism transcriptional regulator PhnF n=1 Tax=Jannaschia sp. 2305UL9-9 TaxID=3121638 RepID=UPI0035271259
MTLWSRIADSLRREIVEGARPEGARLPTEADLAARFGVNRHTVRRALGALTEEGLIRSRRGAGSFVASVPTDYPIGTRVRFRHSMQAAGRMPGKRIFASETRVSTPAEAEALRLADAEEVHVTHGVAEADGRPVALFRAAYPLSRLPGMADALARFGSVTPALAECGVADYLRASTRITAVAASAVEAGHLLVAEGAPLILTEAVSIDVATGDPVEHGFTHFAGDRIALTLDHS